MPIFQDQVAALNTNFELSNSNPPMMTDNKKLVLKLNDYVNENKENIDPLSNVNYKKQKTHKKSREPTQVKPACKGLTREPFQELPSRLIR